MPDSKKEDGARCASLAPAARVGPIGTLALCWAVGTAMGISGIAALWWASAAALPCSVMLYAALHRRYRQACCWALLAAVPLAAGWSAMRLDTLPADHVKHAMGPGPMLQRVRGVIDSSPRVAQSQRGAFAHLHWAPPITSFTIRLESIHRVGRWTPVSGRLIVKVAEADHRPRQADGAAASLRLGMADVEDAAAVDLVLAPGQMSLHHPHLVHGSQPNRSDDRRVGVAFQSYLGAGVRPTRAEHHVMALGERLVDPAFHLVRVPTGQCTQEGRATRRTVNEAFAEVRRRL